MSIIEVIVRGQVENIRCQLPGRAAMVALELKKSVFNVMPGPVGRVSAPGEPPGVQTDHYRTSFQPNSYAEGDRYISKITSNVVYGPFLEEGTRKMAPRPHVIRILDDATPRAIEIYSAPY